MRLSTIFISSAFVLAGTSTAFPLERDDMLVARFADSDLISELEARAYSEQPELYVHGTTDNYKTLSHHRRSFHGSQHEDISPEQHDGIQPLSPLKTISSRVTYSTSTNDGSRSSAFKEYARPLTPTATKCNDGFCAPISKLFHRKPRPSPSGSLNRRYLPKSSAYEGTDPHAPAPTEYDHDNRRQRASWLEDKHDPTGRFREAAPEPSKSNTESDRPYQSDGHKRYRHDRRSFFDFD